MGTDMEADEYGIWTQTDHATPFGLRLAVITLVVMAVGWWCW